MIILIMVPFAVAAEAPIEKSKPEEPITVMLEITELKKAISKFNSEQLILKKDIKSIIDIISQNGQLPVKANVSLNSKTDVNQMLLILVTLVTVVATTVYSVKALNKKTEESISSQIETIKSQRDITEIKVKTEILSGNRQQWINTLRDEISEYLASLHSLQAEILLKGEYSKENAGLVFRKTFLHRAKIHLLINPKEEDHEKLTSLVDDVVVHLTGDQSKLAEYEKAIIDLSQQILKREWERVKIIE